MSYKQSFNPALSAALLKDMKEKNQDIRQGVTKMHNPYVAALLISCSSWEKKKCPLIPKVDYHSSLPEERRWDQNKPIHSNNYANTNEISPFFIISFPSNSLLILNSQKHLH